MHSSTSRSTPESRIAAIAAILLVAALAAAPWWGSTAELRLIGEFMIYLSLASLWNLLAGYAGLISVGQQAYVGFGGYMLFTCAIYLGLNPLLAIPIAGVLGALISIPVALLVFRLNGAYFAIGTWVVAEVFRLGFAQISSLGGGSGTSLPITVMKGMARSKWMRETMIFETALLIGVGTVVVIYVLLRSRIGIGLTAIRDSPIASASLGVRVQRIKLVTYVVVAGMTAMVGSLIFITKLRITPDAAFSVNEWTAFVIFIVVIGGIGTIEGPIIGTIVFFMLREYMADLGSVYLMILGALAIGIMLVAPKGIWGYVRERFNLSLFPVGYRVNIDNVQVSKVTEKLKGT